MPSRLSLLRSAPLLAALGALPLGLLVMAAPQPARDVDWPNVGNDKGGQRYSELDQINRRNVSRLKVAWTYETGDANPAAGTTIECTPIVVDGLMYLTTANPKVKVVALDPATGKEVWKFDPRVGEAGSKIVTSGGVNRGVAFWSDGRPSGPKRIFFAGADGRLISLDAKTGKPDPKFGDGGEIDLRAGMDRDLSKLAYGCTSAPAVFEDHVILGFSVGEGPGPSAPGDIRAFDARTGKQTWRFRTVPAPGELGHDTWKDPSWKERGGANAWSGFTLDARRGIVYAGLGSPAFDFFGGDRPGQNLFGNCTIALDARTGQRLWHNQLVHHDIWDYDLPCPPVVTTIQEGEAKRDVVVQLTKTGHCWILDRLNGKPVFGSEERPVGISITNGEAAWPTQPFPLKPPALSRQVFTPEDVTNRSPELNEEALGRFRQYRSGSIYTPPSLRGTIVLPGLHGGVNWSGASVDPQTGLLYVNSNEMPNVLKLTQDNAGKWGLAGYQQFRDRDGYPGVKPPWGHLTAVDLNKGEFAWRVTLGDFPELKAKGMPPTGTESFGGTIVTAGGLVFIGGTMDEKFRAFDKGTGKTLWETQLPAGGYATPSTYFHKGKQYVVIAAGGGGKLKTKSGDQYLAYALP